MASCYISARLNLRSLAADRGGAQGNGVVRKERRAKYFQSFAMHTTAVRIAADIFSTDIFTT
jgi:hypothetical protein